MELITARSRSTTASPRRCSSRQRVTSTVLDVNGITFDTRIFNALCCTSKLTQPKYKYDALEAALEASQKKLAAKNANQSKSSYPRGGCASRVS